MASGGGGSWSCALIYYPTNSALLLEPERKSPPGSTGGLPAWTLLRS